MDDNRIEEIDDESINTKIEKKNKEKNTILYKSKRFIRKA